jgi:hypothetical protein
MAAIAAFKKAVPDISGREAMLESVAAIHYASVIAPDWLYALYQPVPRNSRAHRLGGRHGADDEFAQDDVRIAGRQDADKVARFRR